MQNIEITTPQNVTIQHKVATVVDRFLAALADALIILVFVVLLETLIEWMNIADAEYIVYLILGMPLVFFYTLTSETLFNGKTIGKMILRIKVMRLDGKPLTFVNHFTRWAARVVDVFLSAASLGFILIISSDRRQRLGGMISGTVVVRESVNNKFSISRIKNLNQYKPEDIQYPEVQQLSEHQMLLLKRLLDRHKRYGSPRYQKMLDEMASRVSKTLNINPKEKAEPFVRRLLKDYIILSR